MTDAGGGGSFALVLRDAEGRTVSYGAESFARDADWLRGLIADVTVAVAEGKPITLHLPIYPTDGPVAVERRR